MYSVSEIHIRVAGQNHLHKIVLKILNMHVNIHMSTHTNNNDKFETKKCYILKVVSTDRNKSPWFHPLRNII